MSTGSQSLGVLRPASTLRRFGAALLAILFAVASVLQAGHSHGKLTAPGHPKAGHSFQAASGSADDAACPLCVAMHSASPVQAETPAGEVPTGVLLSSTYRSCHCSPLKDFALFSRPPPIQHL